MQPDNHHTSARTRHLLAMMALLSCCASSFSEGTNTVPDPVLRCEWIENLQQQLTRMGIELDPAQATEATTLALVKTVDQHARILTEEQWERLKKEHSGYVKRAGFILGITNGLPLINEVESDSPAEGAGLRSGDMIIGFGTQTFQKISLPGIQDIMHSIQDQTVTVRYLRGGITNTASVSPILLPQPTIELAELLPNNIGYIKANGLYAGSGRDLVSRIRAWSETKRDGIILDLRGAGGNDDDAVAQTAGLFGQSGQFLFAYRDHHQQDLNVYKAQENQAVDIPVMVLIDRHTTGASETLAATLNGAARSALLIGEQTAGDFNLRNVVNLSSQIVYITTRTLDTADGLRYNGQFGLEPSVLINEQGLDTHDYEPPVNLMDHREKMEIEERDLATRRRIRGDGVLERAIDILIGLKSLNKTTSTVSSPEVF